MLSRSSRFGYVLSFGLLWLAAGWAYAHGFAQNREKDQSSSSAEQKPVEMKEKAPTLDPAGPTISLISAEPVFLMAAALNACGYDEGLDESAPVRQRVREEINQTLAKSEDARTKRDKLCLYIAQHRMTGTERDVSQYVSLSLYLTPPPQIETTAGLTEMPPDSAQIAEVVPLLSDFAAAVDLHGIWLTTHHGYEGEIASLHRPLSEMIVATNAYLKMPASTYDGRRFIVVIEPMLSPRTVNARIYGTDYVVVVSPVNGQIPIHEVRHTYLHYIIEPLLLSRTNALSRVQPVLKEVRDAPLEFAFRSDATALVIECLIKAIEARTMDTGIAAFKMPAGIDRSEMPRYEREREAVQQKMEAVRQATVQHDVAQGFVLTRYFYRQLLEFEKDPASLRDTIGEMVYSMDVDREAHDAKQVQFDRQSDADVLTRSKPRKLEGLDLAEARLAAGDINTASALARQALTVKSDTLDSAAQTARANFILARTAILSGHPDDAITRFQATLATSKDPRLLAWSHIYLGRMLDLDCKRDQAVEEYKLALQNRDGEQDTRLSAEHGVKAPYSVQGHSCEDEDSDSNPPHETGGAEARPKQP